LIYFIGLYFVVKYAKKGFKMFLLRESDVTINLNEVNGNKYISLLPFTKTGKKTNKSKIPSKDHDMYATKGESNGHEHDTKTLIAAESRTIIRSAGLGMSGLDSIDPKNLKMKGYIWRRRPIEEGGVFKRVFIVLDKGTVDIYKNENHYVSHKAPLNENPFKIWTYVLELDLRKFERHVTSIRAALRRQVLGNAEFELLDNYSSRHNFDKNHALKSFRFALVPKVATELTSQETLELLTETEQEYNTWTATIFQVLEVFDEEGNPTVESTLRTGTKDLETAVRAANYTK